MLLGGQVGGVVPEADDVAVVLFGELADGGGAEHEAACAGGGEVDPAGSECAEDVAVGEQRDVSVCGERSGDDAVGAVADVVGRLASGGAVAPEEPVRAVL